MDSLDAEMQSLRDREQELRQALEAGDLQSGNMEGEATHLEALCTVLPSLQLADAGKPCRWSPAPSSWLVTSGGEAAAAAACLS